MATNNTKYHLEIQTHRKNPYGLLRSSYREDGKVLHKNICRFSGLSLEQLYGMQAALQGRAVMKEDFNITLSREYGASYALHAIMKEIGLDRDIYSRPSEDWVRASTAMVIGRLVYAGSKLSLSHCGSFSALWEVCGIEGRVNVNTHCYETMDRLLERQDAIQKNLAKRHLREGMLVLYDITSSYFEGEYADSDIVEFGYNRDKKRGHEQAVISLLCSKDGCPVAVEVLRGNTKDETTVLGKIAEIKEKYGIEKVVFVGDRGMVTQFNYAQINHETIKVISALTHGTINKLREEKVIQAGLFDEKNIVEVISDGIRYCLCKNPDMAIKEAATRQALLKKTTEELDKIVAGTRKTKDSKEIRAGRVVNKFKMGKFIIFNKKDDNDKKDDNLSYTLNEKKIEQESSLDGCYVIYTDVTPEDMTACEVVASYKSLIKVEQAFTNIKTVRLEVHPMYHKTDNRIKCHVFICMLAYYVMWHIKQRLQPLFESDGKGAKRKHTFDQVMETLKCIRKDTVEFQRATTNVVTVPTDEQNRILQLLGVNI
ncbi:MAG: IS1634 family transposase [Clostridiales bacterium]|nr:IS1634 family transposase [Clostridiales bacterium]